MFGQIMSPRGTSEQRMSPLDIDVVCSKHPGGMIRHGNAIAYLRTFVADCRAWRVRTNLVVVSSRIRQMQDLFHPSKYDALSLDRTGSIESTFTGERDTEWYSDSPSDDGRWVEIVGWLHGRDVWQVIMAYMAVLKTQPHTHHRWTAFATTNT